MLCERCGRDTFKHDVCNYCGKKICSNCIKSSRVTGNKVRLVICKTDWGKMDKRKEFKNTSRE
jgi:late competence protein required for DNA uptake (superfamily II DNA/RNA helicase)